MDNTAAGGIRERNRAAIEAAIIERGRAQLAEVGAAALSLRAIARDLGMVSSAVYRYIANRDDLQYACTFELPTPILCTSANQDACDCNVEEAAYSRPVCQDPTTNLATNTQYYGKAYPGRRELEVARRMRDRAVLASICPRTLEDEQHPSYGYIPVMRAIQRQVTRVLAP